MSQFRYEEGAAMAMTAPVASLIEIEIRDRFDQHTIASVADVLDGAHAIRPHRLVLDLSDCTAIDASAVDLLLATHRRLWHDGGRLLLRAPSCRVHRLLNLAHVTDVVEVEPAASSGRTGPGEDAL
ncbi:STAS domain-containing protein [Catenuloplanes japonicus]|uniref:STAS domain-containing protein n=1 Tax=Catenuloplanes japonicus TaxID=33876 RepID=UPI000527B789|nr:STAS domain-containing protein [Catenuloplanes japonicus]